MKSLKSIGLAAFAAVALLGIAPTQAVASGKPVYTPPYDVEVFVRGSFNGWALGAEMKFDAVENKYVGYVELTPNEVHQFKIASEDWFTVDLGSPALPPGNVVELGVPEPLANTPGYGNMELSVPVPGVYSFTLDPDPANPTVLVEYARKGGDGADRYTFNYYGVPYYFDCLGGASPVFTDIRVEGLLHQRQNPAGGVIYHDTVRIDGVGFDQLGREYRMHLLAPLIFNGKQNGSFTYLDKATAVFIAQDGGPNLYFRYLYKATVGPDGEVQREFTFYAERCSP
jgi:hypothetical protein